MLSNEERTEFGQEASNKIPSELATKEPYRLSLHTLAADVVIRGKNLILQFHLPYPLLRGEEVPSWWSSDEGVFAEVLSRAALLFFGQERKSELRATHTSVDHGGPLVIDSWFFEAKEEEVYAFTTPLEERATHFLSLVDRLFQEALTQKGLPVPEAGGPPYGAAESPAQFLVRYRTMARFGGWRETLAWADALEAAGYPAVSLAALRTMAEQRKHVSESTDPLAVAFSG